MQTIISVCKIRSILTFHEELLGAPVIYQLSSIFLMVILANCTSMTIHNRLLAFKSSILLDKKSLQKLDLVRKSP